VLSKRKAAAACLPLALYRYLRFAAHLPALPRSALPIFCLFLRGWTLSGCV